MMGERFYFWLKLNNKIGSHGIEPTRDWANILNVGYVDAGGGFYYYYNLQCIEVNYI